MTDYQSLAVAPAEGGDYAAYVAYVEDVLGGRREQIVLDENYTKIVTITPVLAAQSLPFIDIRCPAGQKFSIMGSQQITGASDQRTAHSVRIHAVMDASGNEIGFGNKIRITKEGVTDSVTNIGRPFYGDLSLTKTPGLLSAVTTVLKTDLEWYRWTQGIEMNGEQHLIFSTINLAAGQAIIIAGTAFAMPIDVWYF
jgi:hypothetical protein